MSARSILMEAKRLLRDVGVGKGYSCYTDSQYNAIAYCSSGAISKAYHSSNGDYDGLYKATDLFRQVIGNDNIPVWNDEPTRTRNEILSAFEEAISLAEQEEKKKEETNNE